MMKNIRLLALSSLMCLSSVGATKLESKINNFSIAPLYFDDLTTDITIGATIVGNHYLSVQIFLINDLYPDSIEIYRGMITETGTYNVEYLNEYTRPGTNMIRLMYMNIGTRESFSSVHKISVATGSVINLNSEEYQFESKSRSLSLKNGLWLETKEKLVFYNFVDQYISNYYQKIDLGDFYIVKEGGFPKTLKFGEAYFSITNRNGAFDGIARNQENAIIPLTFMKNGDTYALSLKEKLYVHPLSLQMSTIPHQYYVETKHIYFPRNEKRYEGEYQCSIVLKEFSSDSNTFVTHFKYKSLLNVLGNCRNSEYCVINGK